MKTTKPRNVYMEEKGNRTSRWRVKQGVSLNYTRLNWPQAGEALTHSRIQMWWSQGWGPMHGPTRPPSRKQTGPCSQLLRQRCSDLSTRQNPGTAKNITTIIITSAKWILKTLKPATWATCTFDLSKVLTDFGGFLYTLGWLDYICKMGSSLFKVP